MRRSARAKASLVYAMLEWKIGRVVGWRDKGQERSWKRWMEMMQKLKMMAKRMVWMYVELGGREVMGME